MPIRLSLPLPFEPPPPLLVSQQADAEGADDLAQAARWCCELRYRHEHRAQDEVEITVSFNVRADTAMRDAGPALFTRGVVARLIHAGDGEDVEALLLHRTSPATPWPRVVYFTSAGEALDLGDGIDDGEERRYLIPTPQPAPGWHDLGLRWCGLDVARAQNANTALTAVRNRGLVDKRSGIPVYRTTTVTAPQPVAPLNRWRQDFAIRVGDESVEMALTAAVDDLFGDDAFGQPLALALSYAYAPGPADDETDLPLICVPVALQAPQPFDATTSKRIAEALAAWQAANQPPARRAQWRVALVQYAQIAPDTQRPLLDLQSLVYRLG
ncbi:MAG TPA: hypothetical protein VN153_02510 [Tahibacter sp.]|nr:hypothetical protein [Tahibacter sp.]